MPTRKSRRPSRKPASPPKRDPLLSVRIPATLLASLKDAATAAEREFPDWLRRSLPRLLEPQHVATPTTPNWLQQDIKAALAEGRRVEDR